MRRCPAGVLQVCLGLAGCQERVELPDVPIVGGTPEQREQAREELLAFDEWAGAGRVRLTEVSFEPLEFGLGRFDLDRDRIVIRDSRSESGVRITLRHELCHALDYGEDLLKDPHPAFDRYGDLLFSPEGPRHDDASPRERRGEALAQACQIGPFGAHARSVPCDGEPEIAAELARWLAQHVWRGFEPFPPVPRDQQDALVVTACCTDDLGWDGFNITPTASPDRIALRLFEREGPGDVVSQKSLYTGEERGWDPEPAESTWVRPPYPEGAIHTWGTGVSSGLGAAYIRFWIPYLHPEADRLIRTDGTDWALADPACASPGHHDVFAADDRLWFAWDDGGAVRWREMR